MAKFSKKVREKINKKLPTLREKFDPHKREHQVFVTVIVGYIFLLFFIVYSSVMNVPSFANNTNLNVEKPETVKFASDEILIKVRKTAKSKIRENPVDVGVDSLNTLNKEFKTKKMEKAVKESQKSRTDADIFQWYKVKFDEPREELSSTQSEVNTQLNDLINDDKATNIINKSRKKTTGNASKDKFFSRFAKYTKDINIERVEPNYIVSAFQTATPSSSPSPIISINPTSTPSSTPTPTVTPLPGNIPNDPYYSSSGSWGQPYPDLWGIKKINSEGAWNISKGSSNIVVAVVDTGVDRNHEDLQANMWVNTKEIPNNGIDDDANGYVDDYYGCNFINITNKVCSDPMDDNGHGTHVAGTIGAVGNNAKGVVGVNWNSSIMVLKFLNSGGSGNVNDGATAIVYAADNGARVINNSWGGPSYSQVVHDAIEYAHSKNVVIVAAAGNSNIDVGLFSPASEEKVITVAATDSNDQKASFSNYGSKIDVAAPGVDILSTRASGDTLCAPRGTIVGTNYCRLSGTSMATPHVSGLAALILSKHPEFTNEDVRQVLRISADDLGSPGFDINFGRGRINAAKALAVTSVLNVAITSPSSGYDFTGKSSIDFKGTVQGANLVSWELAYGQGISPTSWQSINSSNTPVVNGLLGTMNTSNLNDRTYTLRLLAKDSQGQMFDSYLVVNHEQYVSQLTSGPQRQWMPDISENYIVWFDQGDYTIRLYDLLTKTDRKIWTLPAGWDLQYPQISGNRIVWAAGLNPSYNLYLYDIPTNTVENLTNKLGIRGGARIWGNKIVYGKYEQYPPNQTKISGIYLLDMVSNKETLLINASDMQFLGGGLDIYQDKVVWTDGRYGVILYDDSTGTKRQLSPTNGLFGESSPSIYADKVVWVSEDSAFRVHMYDLSINTEISIPGGYLTASNTRVSANNIVWEGSTCGTCQRNIFSYDIAEKKITQVTFNNDVMHIMPKVSGGRIVWEDSRNTPIGQAVPDWDIYLYNPPTSAPLPTPTPNPACVFDVNHDSIVNSLDLQLAATHYGPALPKGSSPYDVNKDGYVNSIDLGQIAGHYGQRCF